MRAIHLCLLSLLSSLLGKLRAFVFQHFAFRGGYHPMVFNSLSFPGSHFTSHTFSLRQLVNLSEMMTLRSQHKWSHTQVCTGPWEHCSHSSQPAVHSTCPAGTQSSTATSPGGHREVRALLQSASVWEQNHNQMHMERHELWG